MRRDPALVSLSHDHHQALFVAQKLRRADGETAAQALAALNTYWDEHGRAHFRAEEEILFPAYAAHGDPYDPLLARVLGDHVAIRQRVHALAGAADPEPAALAALGSLLHEHVRREERELFPQIEAALPQSELAVVAEALDRAEHRSE